MLVLLLGACAGSGGVPPGETVRIVTADQLADCRNVGSVHVSVIGKLQQLQKIDGGVANELLRSGTEAEVADRVKELIRDLAPGGGYCVGAFNIVDYMSFEAVVAAAEAKHAPVIVQTSSGTVRRFGPRALVKMADLTRIVDIKGVRVRLLYEAGVETVETVSGYDPEGLRERLVAVNEERQILKRHPTLVETQYWIRQAKALPQVVEYGD